MDAIEKKKNFELYSSYQRVDLIGTKSIKLFFFVPMQALIFAYLDSLIGPSGAKLLGDALENAQIVELSLAGISDLFH